MNHGSGEPGRSARGFEISLVAVAAALVASRNVPVVTNHPSGVRHRKAEGEGKLSSRDGLNIGKRSGLAVLSFTGVRNFVETES